MHLITMAHMGEAQGVIDLFGLKKKTSQLFEGEFLNCLITGEGPFEAATSVALELGRMSYHAVINLGIAGTFSDKFEVGSLHPIRSIYLVIENRPQFKSFKSLDQGLDCLTSFERILHAEKASILSGVAPLVDREAWGVAYASKAAGVGFSSYKLISDKAGSLGACEIVREKAEEWSQKLALHLKEILEGPKEIQNTLDLPGFYFTFTTRHQFEQSLKKISLREGLNQEEVLTTLPLNKLREEVTLAKERSRQLLDHMEGRLDPLKEKLKSGLRDFKKPFESEGINLTHDQSWESPALKVSFDVSTTDELEQKLHILKNLKLKPFQDLRNGQFHVE